MPRRIERPALLTSMSTRACSDSIWRRALDRVHVGEVGGVQVGGASRRLDLLLDLLELVDAARDEQRDPARGAIL